LRCVLCFEAASRWKINLAKSELVPVGNVLNVSGLACILGYRVLSLPMKDLGLLLGALSMAKFIWDTIIENMERRLARRKIVYLSKSGRVIKSTLSNLPTYFLFLFSIPIGVAN
jgi:hypothetical protein